MNTKFTPGPWYIDPENKHLIKSINRGKKYQTIAGVGVGELGWFSPLTKIDNNNAKLIAAAPELYEACREAYDIIMAEYGSCPDKLEAAISKAEGK